ncbi:hypothetical protein FRX31_009807 [Thalictrum thalictroides]|uniref:Uncharacterized protein n=1 Tax=Thalictrum thalictroides TaxID=46969 RepID=A0A7J6WT95_THATH|nr:hypothetical protein FRX31_009807 [Thalictrum thalictroides]
MDRWRKYLRKEIFDPIKSGKPNLGIDEASPVGSSYWLDKFDSEKPKPSHFNIRKLCSKSKGKAVETRRMDFSTDLEFGIMNLDDIVDVEELFDGEEMFGPIEEPVMEVNAQGSSKRSLVRTVVAVKLKMLVVKVLGKLLQLLRCGLPSLLRHLGVLDHKRKWFNGH